MKSRVIIATLTAAMALTVGAALPSVALADRSNGHGRHYKAPQHGYHGSLRRSHYRGPRRRGYYRGFGIYLGAPYPHPYPGYWPYYYPRPRVYPYVYSAPYYAPPVVTVPSRPPVYIEKGDSAPTAEEPTAYWYFCAESNAYHPYVKHCPGGWQRRTPVAPPQKQE